MDTENPSQDHDNQDSLRIVTTFLGIIGGLCTCGAMIPIALKSLVHPSSNSTTFLVIYLIGNIFWILYGATGIAIDPVFAVSLTFASISTILLLFTAFNQAGYTYKLFNCTGGLYDAEKNPGACYRGQKWMFDLFPPNTAIPLPSAS